MNAAKNTYDRKSRFFVIFTLIGICLLLLLPLRTEAKSSYSISFSNAAVTVGNKASVKLTVSPAGSSVDLLIGFNTDLLGDVSCSSQTPGDLFVNDISVGNGRVHIRQMAASGVTDFSYTLSFTTKNTGTAAVTVLEVNEITDANGDPMEKQSCGSSTITINPKPTASNEARLKTLRMAPGSMSPAFDPNVTEYKVTVGENDANMVAEIAKMDEKAFYATEVKVNGGWVSKGISGITLPYGNTDYYVHVTAEDGKTVKTYHVVVFRPEPKATEPAKTEPAITEPAKTEPAATEPAATEPATTEPAATEPATTEAETTEAATTEPETTQSPTVIYVGKSVSLIVRELPKDFEIPDGYRRETYIDQEGTEYPVLVPEKAAEPGHILLYGEAEDGTNGLYVYDCKEETLQRYALLEPGVKETEAEPSTEEETTPAPETSAAETAEQTTAADVPAPTQPAAPEKGDEVPQWMFLAASAAALFLLFLLLIVLAKRKKQTEPEDEENQAEAEERTEEAAGEQPEAEALPLEPEIPVEENVPAEAEPAEAPEETALSEEQALKKSKSAEALIAEIEVMVAEARQRELSPEEAAHAAVIMAEAEALANEAEKAAKSCAVAAEESGGDK